MKLKLTPLAVALLLGTGVAHAEVYIDGSFDGGVSINDLGGDNQGRADYDVTIGIGGSDRLDGGGKVKWRLEQGVTNYTANDDQARFGGKEAWIGYEDQIGTVRLGKMKSPLYDMLDARYADTGAKFLVSEYGLGQNVRPGSGIRYDSPNFGGFNFSALYDLDEGTSGHYGYDVAARYANAGLFVDGAYQQRKGADGTDDESVGNVAEFDSQNWYVGAGYNFQNGLGVNGGYKSMEYTPSGGSKVDQDLWFAQGSYTAGKHGAYLTYMQLGDRGDVSDSGAQAVAARYNYSLSKQSIAYLEGRYVMNEANAAYGPTNDTFDYMGAPGEDTSRLMAGLKTNF
ncbi:porin [Chitiniphilus shinanonensis]|uniref:porin n=1 Tax=Chitiniphilus shinanonensis TaxID=553088 RepID=UPI003053470B